MINKVNSQLKIDFTDSDLIASMIIRESGWEAN